MKKNSIGPQAKKEPTAQAARYADLSLAEKRKLVSHVCGTLAHIPRVLAQMRADAADVLRCCSIVLDEGDILQEMTAKQRALIKTVRESMDGTLEGLGFSAEIVSTIDCVVNKRPL